MRFVVWWPCIRAALKTCLRGISFRLCTETGSTPKIALSLFDVKIVGMTWFLMALFMCQVMYLSLEEFSKKYGAAHVDAGIHHRHYRNWI